MMGKEPTYQLVIDQGRPWRKTIRIRDSSTKLPVDLTGWQAHFVARKKVESEDIELELDSDLLGGIEIDDVNGTIELIVEEDVVNSMEIRINRFDLELIDLDGRKPIILTGPLSVRARVAR